MRLIAASLGDAYKVHKTYTEYLHDMGHPPINEEKLYEHWTKRLTDESQRFVLLMHGKKVIGMVWGREFPGNLEKTFLIEGRFIRRGFRSVYRFKRDILRAVKEIAKDFESVMMILPKTGVTLAGKYRKLGVLVEVK